MSAPSDLTREEQANVRRALKFLRARLGRWSNVAHALRTDAHNLAATAAGSRVVSASMAYRVARVAGCGVDDVLTGKYAPANVCPHCGEQIEYTEQPSPI